MTRALVLYPIDDIATSASAYVADRIANMLEDKGFEVFRFDLWKANRLLFTLQQLLNPADFIVYAGHGTLDKWFGSLTAGGIIWPLVDLLNSGMLQNKLCYAVACRTSQKLGKGAPARAYMGWKVDVYVALPAVERNYLEDLTTTFLTIPVALAEGKTVHEASQAYLAKCAELKALYEANLEQWPNGDFYAMAVKNNMEGFELLGDPYARIT
ncbi:MAG: hypothetical protein OEY22_02270 [Candidatus Bathyarchaeota archaeon]|nr:hypothetical protein [Candidatus Bathyarchaeota archaeon]